MDGDQAMAADSKSTTVAAAADGKRQNKRSLEEATADEIPPPPPKRKRGWPFNKELIFKCPHCPARKVSLASLDLHTKKEHLEGEPRVKKASKKFRKSKKPMLKCDACNPVTNDWNCFTKHTKVSCKNSKLNLTAEKATQTEPIATATKATTNNHSTQAEIKQTEQKVAKHCQVKSYGSNMKKSESVAQLQVKPKYHAKEKPSKNHHMRKKKKKTASLIDTCFVKCSKMSAFLSFLPKTNLPSFVSHWLACSC